MSDQKRIPETNSKDGSGRPDSKQPNQPRGFAVIFIMLLMMGLLGMVIFSDSLSPQEKSLNATEVVNYVREGKVKAIKFEAKELDSELFTVSGELSAGAATAEPARFKSVVSKHEKASIHALQEDPKSPAHAMTFDYEPESNMGTTLLVQILPIVLIGLIIWFLFLRRGGSMGGAGGVFSFGRSRAKMFNREDSKVSFADVAGVDEAKEELSEIVQFLKNPGRFTRIGAKIPRGVVMFGPPGCGKTLLAKAIAGEAERPFFSISGSDFVEMFVGVGASRVRDLFKNARENAPCIVFVDEIDAVGRKRGTGLGGGHDEREQTLNAILVEMDGIGTEDGIIVVAATNRPDVLDPALLRPGRFDRQVVIDLPDARGREAIIKVHMAKVKYASDIDYHEVAQATPGFSGADIANLINEAALAAVLDSRDMVQMGDLLEARDKVRFGRQKRSRVMDEQDRRVTAYHEAGHTVVQHLTPNTDPVHKVTIIPRGMALGATMSLPEKDRYSLSRETANELIAVLYGGRIAEAEFIGSISSGAENDIERATQLATNMVVKYGFSDVLGPINYAEAEERDFLGGGITKLKSHSDSTATKIDNEVRRILDDGYRAAESIIREHRTEMEAIAQALLAHETLDASDVKWIMDGKDIAEKKHRDREDAQRREAARRLAESEKAARRERDARSSTTGTSATPEPA